MHTFGDSEVRSTNGGYELLKVALDSGQSRMINGSAGFLASNEADDMGLQEDLMFAMELKRESEEEGDEDEMEALHPLLEDMDVDLLKHEIVEHRKTEKATDEELQHQISMWEERRKDLLSQIEAHKEEVEHREHLIASLRLRHAHDDGHHAPGPVVLHFLEEDKCMVLSSGIIVTNIVMLIMELMQPKYEITFFWFDQLFMVFYCCELTLKAIYYQRGLVFGDFSVVWWNWLDIVIVVSGVFDMWLTPLLAGPDGAGHQSHGLLNPKLLRMLRLARLARIMKIVHVFMESDFDWTEGERFQGFIMGVIGANAIIMGFEADFPAFWGWFYVEQTLLFIFMFELLVRLKRKGWHFFLDKHDWVWNWLDFVIVGGAMMDAYLLPLMDFIMSFFGGESRGGGSLGQVMMMLRMFRLLRILRLVRLIKNIGPLYVLIKGIAKAMQGMLWVVVLTGLLLYICGLLAVKLIGHGLLFPDGKCPENIDGLFPDVLESMFVLFNVMNGQDVDGLDPLLEAMPFMKVVIMCFTIISTWAILSILTAVVSENMLQATEQHREETEEEAKIEWAHQSIHTLSEIFETADENGDGTLLIEEFESIIGNEELRNKVCGASSGMTERDLVKLFDYLSVPMDGKCGDVVQRVDFIDGLQREHRPVSERSILRLEKRIHEMEKTLKKIQDVLCPEERLKQIQEEDARRSRRY